MDFIRKNWSRLSIALLYLVGGVLAVVAWVNFYSVDASFSAIVNFRMIATLIATLAFFLGMIAIAIVKSVTCSKKAVSLVYMIMGGVATIAMLAYIITASFQDSPLFFGGIEGLLSFYQIWVPFFVFALHPLVKGVTRFIEMATVPAKAAPVEQPAVEAVAEEKAPAKKATKAKAAK